MNSKEASDETLSTSLQNRRAPTIYDWFRCPVDLLSDPIIDFVEAEFGTEGLGRFMKLSAQLISQMKFEYGPIVSELSVSTWCSRLGCKKKGLIRFLDHLKNEGHLSWEQRGNILRIEMPKLAEVFDLSMPIQKFRGTKAPPRQEKTIPDKMREEEKIEQKTNSDFSFLTDKDHDRLKAALSQSGKEAISATSAVVESIFSKVGKSEDVFSKVQSLITHQFSNNEKSRPLGEAVLAAAKQAYREGLKENQNRQYADRFRMEADARRDKLKASPNVQDPICRSVIRRLGEAGGIKNTDITTEEAEHFIRLNTDYWGGEEVRAKYQEVIQFINKSKESEETVTELDDDEESSPPKKSTLPGKNKTAPGEAGDFDDDDPTPDKLRKTVTQGTDENYYDS